ncbi:hypothetical protein AA0498_0604 [Acidomonas methanolica]|nr:hypothetical protein AA0498_0604 [Acidomonas methanolica]
MAVFTAHNTDRNETLSSFLTTHGGGRRVRTDDPLLAKQVLSQLSYAPQAHRYTQHATTNVVGQGGLEPPTPRLSSVCSNQLSY